ncbi:MAG: hypothetical protein ACM3VS_17715 [Candidatus Dadabacteria bacterium]
MKNVILFLFILVAANANAQTLKDLLYSGKLKVDSNTVIRKTDDYKSKSIDSLQKKIAEAPKVDTIATIPVAAKANPIETTATPIPVTAVVEKDTMTKQEAAAPVAAPEEVKAPVKSNSKIWKEYSEALINSLKTEVLPSKKVKKETYYFTVEYVIEPDGKATIGNITSDPDNAVLTTEVKNRITNEPPQFSPVLDSNGKGMKVKKRSNFLVTKD